MLDSAPLAANKTNVKLFDLSNMDCGNVGKVLLNEVQACSDKTGDRKDCLDLISTDSKTLAPFVK